MGRQNVRSAHWGFEVYAARTATRQPAALMQNFKTGSAKVAVEGERLFDAHDAHDGETGAIDGISAGAAPFMKQVPGVGLDTRVHVHDLHIGIGAQPLQKLECSRETASRLEK